MYYYETITKDGRIHGGCHETKEEVQEALRYFGLDYNNPDVVSVRVYEKR